MTQCDFKSCNYDFVSHNSDFISHICYIALRCASLFGLGDMAKKYDLFFYISFNIDIKGLPTLTHLV